MAPTINQLIRFGRRQFTDIWNQYLLPKGCEEREVVWEDIWIGKSLLFDFDNADNPMIAFHRADKVARYLTRVLKATCYMVFSGSKGFHVHVSPEDSLRLTGVNFKDFKEMKDPLKKIGKIYADKIKGYRRHMLQYGSRWQSETCH